MLRLNPISHEAHLPSLVKDITIWVDISEAWALRLAGVNAAVAHRGRPHSSGTGLLVVEFNDIGLVFQGILPYTKICVKLTVRSLLVAEIARIKSVCRNLNCNQRKNMLSTKANSYRHAIALVNALRCVPTVLSFIYNDRFILARCFELVKTALVCSQQ